MDFMNGGIMSPMTVKDVIKISVNDTPLTLDGYELPGSDQMMNFTNWHEFKVNDVSVKQGANTIIVTTIAAQGPNMDCIKVYGDLGIQQTEAKQPEKVSIGTYTYFVNGYEWGPGVYKIVADLGEGNNVKASDLSNDLFSVSAKGSQGGSRTVTDIYLVDENNEKDESLTEGTKIGFDLELNVTSQNWGFIMTSYNGCNPFYYDMATSKNSWAKDYTYEIRLNSNKTITVGDKTYNGREAILTINTPSSEVREIPCLENWGEQQSYTLNDRTLTYKAFETTALKEDGGKNLLYTDWRRLLLHVVPALPGAEEGKAHEQRGNYSHDQGNAPVGHRGAAADGEGAGGEHGDEDGGGGAADTCKEGGAGGELVAGIGIGTEGGYHAPVGDVVHGVGY